MERMREVYNNLCGHHRSDSDRTLSKKNSAPVTVVSFSSSSALDNLALDFANAHVEDSASLACCSATPPCTSPANLSSSRLAKLGNIGRKKNLSRLGCPPKIPWLHHSQLQIPRQDPALDFLVNRRLYHLRPYNSVYPEYNALMDLDLDSTVITSAGTTSLPAGTYTRQNDPLQSYIVDQPRIIPPHDNLRFNQKSLSELDRRRQHRLNQRDSKTNILFSERDRGLFERDGFHDDGSNGPIKHHFLKPTELRNNYVSGQQLLPSRSSTLSPDKESEDIIAMGSTWVPTMHARNTNIPRQASFGLASSSMPGQLSVSQAPIVTGTRRVSRTSSTSYITGRCQPRDDQGYADPLLGAPASLQQRLSELAGLEAETIRWERTKKTKKKTKDS